MKVILIPIAVSLLFAFLLIASSYFLKTSKIGDWVDAGIYLSGAYVFFRYYYQTTKNCHIR
ncbi:MAG TPA: hypothetical protein VM888_02695 [Chitinophagaceae bacterium]|jgi:hypothetical protein|nr:hypothetical protein [Chitinophagaceae bacterium]